MPSTHNTGRSPGQDDERQPAAQFGAAASTPLLRSPSDGLATKCAAERSEWLSSYQLVYLKYLEMGYIEEHPSRTVYRAAWGHPLSRTIIAQDADAQIVGTVTAVDDEQFHLPIEETFAAEIAALRRAGRSMVELTGLAICAPSSRQSLSILFVLTRFAVQFACWRKKTDMVFTVHPRHAAFYRSQFEADVLGPCRAQSIVRGHPGIACRIDLKHLDRLALTPSYFQQRVPARLFQKGAIPLADHTYFCHLTGISPADERLNPTRRQDAA